MLNNQLIWVKLRIIQKQIKQFVCNCIQEICTSMWVIKRNAIALADVLHDEAIDHTIIIVVFIGHYQWFLQ